MESALPSPDPDREAELETGRDRSRTLLAMVLLAYLAAAAGVVAALRGNLSIDGFAYLQMARHLVAGRFDLGISAYWSPLYSLAMVPLIALGVPPLAALDLVAVGTGALQVGAAWYLGRVLGLGGTWLAIGTGVVAVKTLRDVVWWQGPDNLVAALLLLVLAAWMAAGETPSRPAAIGIGLLGGLAYLAKAYALPFLFVWFPMAAWIEHRSGRTRAWGKAARALLGLLAVSLPWVIGLRLATGTWTLSSAGGYNHALVGPDREFASMPTEERLAKVPAGRLLAWEVPTDLPVPAWSPLASERNLRHQAWLVALGLGGAWLNLATDDDLRLRTLAALALLVLALAPAPPGRRPIRERLLVATLGLFVAGYLPGMSLPTRYYYFPLTVLTLVAVRLAQQATGWAPALPLAIVLILGFGIPPLRRLAGQLGSSARARELQDLAARLRPGWEVVPFASTRLEDYPLALLLESPFTGRPAARDPAGLCRELEAVGALRLIDGEGRPEVDALVALGRLRVLDPGARGGDPRLPRLLQVEPGRPCPGE